MKLNLVPARTGLLWVQLGLRTFAKQPLALTGLFFLYVAAVVGLAHIPLVGQAIGLMLVPAATLGLMAATAQAAEGRFPMPLVLLSAFRAGRQNARAMLVLGAVYAAGSLLAAELGGFFGSLGPAVPVAANPADGASAAAPNLTWGMAISLLLQTPLVLVMWHAPALVHWHGISPGKSMFFSAVACFRNIAAFTVYSVAWAGLFMLASLLATLTAALFGGPAVLAALVTPLALVMAAMFSVSVYFTFRDSFVPPASTAQPTTGDPS